MPQTKQCPADLGKSSVVRDRVCFQPDCNLDATHGRELAALSRVPARWAVPTPVALTACVTPKTS
jgi:hypothetical protein